MFCPLKVLEYKNTVNIKIHEKKKIVVFTVFVRIHKTCTSAYKCCNHLRLNIYFLIL